MKIDSSGLSGEFLLRRTIPGCPVIDVHSHPLAFGGAYLPCSSTESFAASLVKNGVMLCLIASHAALGSPQENVSPDIRIVKRYPERIRAWYTYNPRYDSIDNAKQIWNENPGVFAGFKLHPEMHDTGLSDPGYDRVLAWSEENSLPVLCHTWAGSPVNGEEQVKTVMKRHPQMVFFAGHSLDDNWQCACELSLKYPGFYMELTAAGAMRNSLEHMVAESGSSKILFGTDLPWFATMHGVGCLLSADISDDDRRKILYKNAAGLFGRYEWFKQGFASGIHVI